MSSCNKPVNSPKSPKQQTKKKTSRKNPLRQGVSFNSMSNMLKAFAIKKRNMPEIFQNINDKLKR